MSFRASTAFALTGRTFSRCATKPPPAVHARPITSSVDRLSTVTTSSTSGKGEKLRLNRLVARAAVAVAAVAISASAVAASHGFGSRSHPYPRGAAVRLDNDWVVKVVRVNWSAWPVVHAANQFNTKPKPGRVDVLVTLHATYRGKGSDQFSDGEIKSVGRSNVGYATFNNSCGVVPHGFLDTGDVFAGGSITANLCWQVRTSDVASLLMYYDSFSSQVFFRLR